MQTTRIQGGSLQGLRPFKTVGGGFPVYPDLVEDLVRRGPEYDERTAHVCAVLSGWAYSDAQTVSTMMVRMGLEHNRCRYIGLTNETMFVCSSAFLIQSLCGRVAFLAYRGTEPLNFINWLTDADVNPVTLPVSPSGSSPPGASKAAMPRVHAGFYRNQRATWFDVAHGLVLALEGKSILEGTPEGDNDEARRLAHDLRPLEALYITGHSLGAAMAAMAAFRLARDESYAAIRAKLRGIYTYGQPMLGNSAFAAECEKHELLSDRLYRHVFGNDIVPALPPHETGDFRHFGRQFNAHRVEAERAGKSFEWRPSATSATQAFLPGIVVAESDFAVEQIPLLRRLAGIARHAPLVRSSGLGFSLYDHSTTYYIACSQPEGVSSEFGDF